MTEVLGHREEFDRIVLEDCLGLVALLPPKRRKKFMKRIEGRYPNLERAGGQISHEEIARSGLEKVAGHIDVEAVAETMGLGNPVTEAATQIKE